MQRGDKGVSDGYLKAQHQPQQGFALTHCPSLCFSVRLYKSRAKTLGDSGPRSWELPLIQMTEAKLLNSKGDTLSVPPPDFCPSPF